MAERSEISWTDGTFNPWHGCAKVSPACDNCYAERDSKRFSGDRVLWGVDAERRVFGDKHWNDPVRWNAKAAREGRRMRVFCASMADVFDKNAPPGARERLWKLIEATPNLDWLLLTKRIGNARAMLPARWFEDAWPMNARIGITVINQEEYDRDVGKLLALWCDNFLSIEPMLGPIKLDLNQRMVDWVIVGGESGPNARPAHPNWFRSLRDQCAAASVPFHLKQHGEWLSSQDLPGDECERTDLMEKHDATSRWIELDGQEHPGVDMTDDMRVMLRVGKKTAGWMLDGREHKAFPGSAQ